MTSPHIPAWIEDVTAELSTRFEAEAVFLVGSRARDDDATAGAFELLVLVDNQSVESRGRSVDSRWESLDGFAGPVAFLRVSLAELLAGAYAGGTRWRDLVNEAHALHDPLGYAARILGQREQLPAPPIGMLFESALRSAGDVDELAQRDSLAAKLVVTSVAYEVAAAAAQVLGNATTSTAVSASLRSLGPGPLRAYNEVLAELTGDSLRRLIDVLKASLDLRGFTS
jgi:alkylation response protein AidB-like acyl-CoA dehydrogenase